MAKITLKRALELQPDNDEIKKTIRNIRKATDLKDQAS
jgi:hypothetical protein